MTLHRALHVTERNEDGSPVTTQPAPGSSPDFPAYVVSYEGETNRSSPEGGYIDRITDPVSVKGPVPVTLSDAQFAALLPKLLALDGLGRLPVVLTYQDPPLEPEYTPVLVTDTVTTRPEKSHGNAQYAAIVSTTAVLIVRSNVQRKCLVICNNGGGTLYLGNTSSVTASGAGMGLKVPAGGRYTDSGDGINVGDVWGIYSVAATTQNVAVSDRT